MNSATSTVSPLETHADDASYATDQPPSVESMRLRIAVLEAELAHLVQAQSAMAHGISHDLRAPFRAIDGFAIQLARELDDDEAAEQQVAKIRAAVSRMGSLMESLLEYSRIARVPLKRETVDVSFLADWALMDIRGQHPELTINADIQSNLEVQGDERQLRTLLDKVFDNSRKFAKAGEAVALQLRGTRTDAGMELTLSDEGVGMPMRDAEQPFQPFMRLHGNREGGGDGLGLSIVQGIVHRHGGRIWIESSPGDGMVMHIVLPDMGPASD